MALQPGTSAPDFTLCSSNLELFKLSDNKDKNIVLLFVPMAFTSVCTKEFCEISSGITAYEALDAHIIGISGDSPFALKNWAEKEGISLKLLSDYDHKVTAAYDVAYTSFLPDKNLIMGGVPKRSAFIIDKAGVIQYSESHDDPGQLPDFEKIKAKLADLK